jgi:hypothetical protein
MTADVTQMLRDYGSDVTTLAGRRAYERACQPASPLTECGYVARCRQLHLRDYGSPLRTHRDWVAAGFNRVPPKEWMGDGPRSMTALRAYWEEVAPRPDRPNSPYNPAVGDVIAAFWASVPVGLAAVYRSRGEGARRGRISRSGLRRLADIRRATARRGWRDEKEDGGFRRDALRALGRLCPELQRVALETLRASASLGEDSWKCGRHGEEWGRRVRFDAAIRARDLPWGEIALWQRAFIERPALRALFARGRRLEALGVALPGIGEVCPEYPNVPWWIAVHIRAGESPRRICGDLLTRGEAHELFASWETPGHLGEAWSPEALVRAYAARLLARALPEQERPHGRLPQAVAQWIVELARRGWLEDLTRERTIRIRGEAIQYRLIARLDELTAADVADCPRPMRAFEAAAARASGAAAAAEDHTPYACLPAWLRGGDAVTVLASPSMMVAEGQRQHHCTACRWSNVSATHWFVAIRTDAGASTAEIDSWTIVQHYGRANSTPPDGHRDILRLWLDNMRRASTARQERKIDENHHACAA